EAECLGNVSLCFFRATNEDLTESDIGLGVRKISVKLKRAFAFSDAFCGSLGPDVDKSQPHMAARMARGRRQSPDQFRFGRSEGRGGIGPEEIDALDRVRA